MASGDASQPLVGAQMVDRGQNTLPGGQGIVILESTIERIDDSESLQSEFAPWWDGSDSKSGDMIVLDAEAVSYTHLTLPTKA